MLVHRGPKSNAERQREFCKRNPGYYARLKRAERARVKALMEQIMSAAPAISERREPLMLPAPVEHILIPGLNAIPTSLPVREESTVVLER